MEIDIIKITAEDKMAVKDTVTDEAFLTVHLNDRVLLTLSCTPENEKELCAGFLFSSGLIHTVDDIERIFIDKKNMAAHVSLKDTAVNPNILFDRIYTSGCGKGVLFHNVLDLAHQKVVTSPKRVQSAAIIALMKSFEHKSIGFKSTGGVHSAALSDGNTVILFSEDIGRHNALDKVIGAAMYQNISMEESIVLISGRISSEIMYKIQKMGSPMIVSRSAPTNMAVELAKKMHVTLVGFVRGKRMNVYAATERVV